jgi:nitrate reductase NapD
MNISSIIVKVLPSNFEEVVVEIEKSGVGEIFFKERDKGIIIVVIEGKNVEEEIEKVRVLEALPKVISADMHMSYCEEELQEMQKDIDFQKAVEEVNSDKPIEEINYFGSLKGKY